MSTTLPATELFRFFQSGALYSRRSDATTYVKRIGTGWKLRSTKKAEVTYDQWLINKQKHFNALEPWQRNVRSLPSEHELERWAFDSICETTDGEICEPDAGAHGSTGPSWLVALGLI